MKIKIIAIIDWEQQGKENNISFQDYPMKNRITGRKLKGFFSKYYSSWKEYISLDIDERYSEA